MFTAVMWLRCVHVEFLWIASTFIAPSNASISKPSGAKSRMIEPHTDTPPHVTRLQRELFQQRTGEERLRMACAMSDLARALVLASLPEAVRNDPSARRAALLHRFYGRELGPDRVAAILAYLAGGPPSAAGGQGVTT